MKRFKYIFLLAASVIGITGCSKLIDDAYTNPNASIRTEIAELFPGIIGNMVGSSAAAGSAYGLANDGVQVGRYVQFWAANVANNQYDQMGGAVGASDVLGSVWAMHYFGMGQNLNRIIEWGTEEQKWSFVGAGLAIRAWSMLNLTNMYGEAIVREAFNTSALTFKYDEQAFIYDTLRQIAHQAIATLERPDAANGQSELAAGDAFFYQGDLNKWKKFAYAVLARSFNQLSNKVSYNADSVIYYADLAINTNADNATAKFANTGITGTSNFYGPYRANMGSLRQTAFVTNLMTGRGSLFTGVEDPRTPYLLREDSTGAYNGILPNRGTSGLGVRNRPFGFWGQAFATNVAGNDNNARYIFKNGAEFPIITAAEIKFIKAEALLRKSDNAGALEAYKEGIRLNMEMLRTTYNASIPSGAEITDEDITNYLNDPVAVPAAEDLGFAHIMLQKYIAMYGYAPIETWTDMRRFHYTDTDPITGLQVYTDFVVPTGLDLYINNNNKLVQRARPRYNSEYLYNVTELDRIGALALDYHTKEQWFSTR